MSEKWVQMALFGLWALPAFLPLIIRPMGENRFGASPEVSGFWAAVRSGLKGYVNFKGRASRSEYGWFLLLFLSTYLTAEVIEEVFKASWFHAFSLMLLLPYLAVSARRLHDLNRSGWWQLLGLGVGIFVLFFMLAEPSDEEKAAREAVAG